MRWQIIPSISFCLLFRGERVAAGLAAFEWLKSDRVFCGEPLSREPWVTEVPIHEFVLSCFGLYIIVLRSTQ